MVHKNWHNLEKLINVLWELSKKLATSGTGTLTHLARNSRLQNLRKKMTTHQTSSHRVFLMKYHFPMTKRDHQVLNGFTKLNISSSQQMDRWWKSVSEPSGSSQVKWFICKSLLSTLYQQYTAGTLCLTLHRLDHRITPIMVMVVIATATEAEAIVTVTAAVIAMATEMATAMDSQMPTIHTIMVISTDMHEALNSQKIFLVCSI